ncbi:molybdenum cofactor biosynthesis protein MoaB, partial [Nostoc sp. CHAB 5834]|nr:molybdenum cofactor biosynthesis protein MoaB [Nostoc sp. CHAB 5834]
PRLQTHEQKRKLRTSEAGCGESRTPRFNRELPRIIPGIDSTKSSNLDAVIFSGGTGIAPRDTTYDAIEKLLEKTLPGFGELFRFLSYQEIGSRAIASRAVAGVYQNKLIFSLPGSSNAVRLAMEKLILPELTHLVSQVCN